nr:hypothetical protein [Tanacetum cinerariifolium]
MHGDETESLSGFEKETDDHHHQSKHKEEFSKADEEAANSVLDKSHDMANSNNANKPASADKPPQSDPFGHHLVEFSSLIATLHNLESSVSQKIADKIEES